MASGSPKIAPVEVRPFTGDHDRWTKKSLVEDEALRVRELGTIPDMRAIEEEVDESMQRVLARKREAKPGVARRPPQEGAPEQAQRRAERLGYRLERRPVARPQKPARQSCACGGCKACKLQQRLRALMEYDSKRREFLFPAMAKAIVGTHRQAVSGSGDFKGKPLKERNRILTRKLEDVADRSVGFMGAWR